MQYMDPFIKIHFLQFPKDKYSYQDQSGRSHNMDREDLRHFQTTPNAKKLHIYYLFLVDRLTGPRLPI
jgi:hypothetical protein